ncbi:hypothetical protein ALC62_13003 [Cyphomyrmex costatus]|uniref:Uncharacterized protein n=1 Tax=Cyphomyrmex costatus TaxID=456900 RepID=A0A195C676_9HYME|nr:hypothetical protein ALC62_13003 [Cyphomyrmex costatus]
MKENGRWTSSGGLATSLASPGRGARAFCSDRKVRGEEARGVQDRPAGREAPRSVRKRNGTREEDETRESPTKNGSPSNYVNKTFCSRFWECGRAGPPEEILPIWGKGQWTRHPCPGLTLRTDIIAWESAISRKRHSFFQDDFSRRAGRRTRRKDLVNNDRLMSPLPLSRACGGFHISDLSRK